MQRPRLLRFLTLLFLVLPAAIAVQAQSGSVTGAVTDPSGAVIPGATVTIASPVSGYTRSMQSDDGGHFQFVNVPFNQYRLTISISGFEPFSQAVNVSSLVAVTEAVKLNLESTSTSVRSSRAPIWRRLTRTFIPMWTG